MTKRKNSRIDSNDRFRNTGSGFHEAPDSEFHISKITTLNSPTRIDIGHQKEVKFGAPKKYSSKSCRSEDSYRPAEREKVTTRADTDPKTSEYAFFKKLKKDAGLRFRSHPLQKDADLLKKPESIDYSRERTDDIRVGNKDFNFPRFIEDMSTVKTNSFLSPSGGAWNKSDVYSFSSTWKGSEGCGNTFEPQGNQYVHGQIFSRKRQMLRQCIADALFPDIEKLCSKGHDIVPMLLCRLFPASIGENKYEDPNPGKVVNAAGYDLLDSRELDAQFTERHQISTRKLLELESISYFSDHLLSPMFLRSDDTNTPHAEFPTSHSHKFGRNPGFSYKSDETLGFLYNEVVNATRYGLLDSQESDIQFKEHHPTPKTKLLEFESNSYIRDHLLSPIFIRSNERIIPHADSPTSHSLKFQPLHSIREPECAFGGTPSFSAKTDVTLGFLLNEQEHETFTLNHFKELETLKREPIPLLLEKDFDCTSAIGELNLPISYTNVKPDMVPALSTLGNGEEQMLNNILGEYHVSPSSLLLDKPQPQDFNSMLDSGLLRYQEFRFGKYVYENKDNMDTNFNHSALSHNKHYLKLSEDCKNDTSCVQDSIYLSPYQHWIRRTVSNDYHHHPDTEAWLTSSLDFISGRRCLSLTSSHSNYQSSNSSTSTLQLPQRESMSPLFNSDDNYEPEMDGGNHGEVLYHFSEGLIGIYNSSFLHMSMQSDNGFPFPLNDSDYINEQEQTHRMLFFGGV